MELSGVTTPFFLGESESLTDSLRFLQSRGVDGGGDAPSSDVDDNMSGGIAWVPILTCFDAYDTGFTSWLAAERS